MIGSGANINNLSQDVLKGLEVPLPSMEEQRRIVVDVDAEIAEIRSVGALIPRFEARIQGVLDHLLGNDQSG